MNHNRLIRFNFFRDGLLDEYGVPAEIALKLMAAWEHVVDVDDGLRMLAKVDLDGLDLQPFERELIVHVRKSLPARAYGN